MPRGIPRVKAADRPRKREQMNVRVTVELRAQMEALAAANGRNLTQEVEYRLQQSVDQEKLVFELAQRLEARSRVVYKINRALMDEQAERYQRELDEGRARRGEPPIDWSKPQLKIHFEKVQ